VETDLRRLEGMARFNPTVSVTVLYQAFTDEDLSEAWNLMIAGVEYAEEELSALDPKKRRIVQFANTLRVWRAKLPVSEEARKDQQELEASERRRVEATQAIQTKPRLPDEGHEPIKVFPVGGPYTPLWWTPKEGYRKSDGPQAEPGDTLLPLVWPASAGSQEECAVLDALERYEKVCSASHAGKARKGYRSPVTEAIWCICRELQQDDALEISPHAILDILRDDSFYGPQADVG
jgi:hypothetical protein